MELLKMLVPGLYIYIRISGDVLGPWVFVFFFPPQAILMYRQGWVPLGCNTLHALQKGLERSHSGYFSSL